jgi:hypothetical protein
MFLYPNEMVPLQTDLAIGDRRYLQQTRLNPANCPRPGVGGHVV